MLINCRDYGLKRESQGKRENVRGEKKILKQHIESYSNHADMHDYYSTFGYIQSYASTNVGVFWG